MHNLFSVLSVSSIVWSEALFVVVWKVVITISSNRAVRLGAKRGSEKVMSR